MKIAVIGATGMIGNHTARAAVAAGHSLRVVHRESSNLKPLTDVEFESAVADLDEPDSLKAALDGVDAVINAAGYYPTLPRPWREDVDRALEQMNGFYDACAAHDLQKIVYVGAAIALPKAAPGEKGHADLYYENPPASKNAYLRCKWAMDELARERAASGQPVVVGIPAMCFGEYDVGPSTGQLITGIANGTLPAYVRGNRTCVYTGDAGRGLVLAAEKGKPGERYLFCGEDLSMDDMVTLIAGIADAEPPKPVPLFVARVIGLIQLLKYRLGGPPPRISSTAIAVMSAGQFLDGSKSERELGFKAEVSISDAIRRALNWFRENGYIDN